jgi:hypothetical protein
VNTIIINSECAITINNNTEDRCLNLEVIGTLKGGPSTTYLHALCICGLGGNQVKVPKCLYYETYLKKDVG